jgi:NDP-sugar pyrophosphorylase family protein
MKPTLVVLAAGMGSRYGKLKQMDGFGPNGETIIEYSLYDAIKAGFGKVVFIIRKSFSVEFIEYFDKKLHNKIEVAYVFQELDALPEGFTLPEGREKPWGTAHALWVAADVVKEPFGVINADDYYGISAYKVLADFLIEQHKTNSPDYGVVGYFLKNTLSEHGTVNRGVCEVDSNGNLVSVKECVKIKRENDGVIRYSEGENQTILEDNTLVSMNMWAFLPSYFSHCEKYFTEFLKEEGQVLNSEFFIPKLIDELIKGNILNVHALDTDSDWFGVTYQEDKPFVSEKIKSLMDKGAYPNHLWE